MADVSGKVTEPGLLVLMSLVVGPRHGYAVAEDIEAVTGSRPGPGTLYGAISRLVDAGLIRELAGDGRRRPYALTPAGREHVEARVAALTALTREANRRLRARPRTRPA